MKRFFVALIAGTAVFSIAFAAAAALSVDGGVLQAGADDTLTCTESVRVDGWVLETDDGNEALKAVRIQGFGPCGGNEVFVRLTDADGNFITGNLEPADGNPLSGAPDNEQRFNIPDPGVDPADVHDIHVWIST